MFGLKKSSKSRIIVLAIILSVVALSINLVTGDKVPSCIKKETQLRYDVISVGTVLNFNAPRNSTVCGWSQNEYWGTWSDGKVASLDLQIPDSPTQEFVFKIESRPFLEKTHNQLKVNVFANGKFVQLLDYKKGELLQTKYLTITKPFLNSSRSILRITFEFVNPATPSSLGVNGDSRLLGIGLERLTLVSSN